MSYQNKEIIFFLPNFSQVGASESTVKLMTYLKKSFKFLGYKSLHNYEFHKLEEKFLNETLF